MNKKEKLAICTTTIFPIEPFLQSYTKNIRHFDHTDNVKIYIAGDNKSPADSLDVATRFSRDGFNIEFLSISEQHDYLKKFPDLAAIIPENSDNRRNVAYLKALEEDADIVVSVDDDNFPMEGIDFVGGHLQIGKKLTLPAAVGHNGWYNLCSLLNQQNSLNSKDKNLFPRGYPYRVRHEKSNRVYGTLTGRIGINVGLWCGDPDTDAIGRLYAKPYIDRADEKSVLLGESTLSPINTQNTALSKEAMHAYYYVRMGEDIRGMRLDRFGDIFSGFFVQLCASAVGDRIRIGSPVMDHQRNQHDLLVDLYYELAGIMILEDLSELFYHVQLPGDSYASAYRKLSYELEKFTERQDGFIWTPETKAYFRRVGSYMRIWLDTISSIG